jgi:thioredoxin-like negative regulator of GroEL
MKLWPFFSLLLLVQQSLPGQEVAAKSEWERRGEAALADGLWEIAEQHFRVGLADAALTPAAKSMIAVRLAESLIRTGNSAEALVLLTQSFVVKHPEAPFWKAHALTGQHRFTEAAALFSASLADSTAPYRTETGMTLASLQLALNHPEAALETLATLIPDAPATATVKIRLYQVEILLDLKRTVAARQALPASDTVAAADRPLLAFLEAQLLLTEADPAAAETGFRELVNHPQGQTLRHFHSAAIGLADALLAQKKPEEAAKSLLTFIQDHSASPLLDAMFHRIFQCLPELPTTTDPILEQLALWIPPPTLTTTHHLANLGTDRNSTVAAWPTYTPASDLADRLALSLYTRAMGLHRIRTADTTAEAQRLLKRLRLENPVSHLANRALYQSARWLLDAGSVEQAFSILNTLRDISKSPELRGEAAFVEARATYLNGDPRQAILLFDEAASTLSAPEAHSARLLAAIARLQNGDPREVTLIQQQGTTQDKELGADLELERALSATLPRQSRPLLENFLTHFPDHPRAAEARLTLAEAALAGPSPDFALAVNQLSGLVSAPENFASRIALLRLRIVDLSKDTAATLAQAKSIMETYPGDPAAEAALTLGRTLFQTGVYHDARLVLEKLAAEDLLPVRAQAAWLLAARSAALSSTPQSREQATTLFDKAAEIKGPLTAIAMLEEAGHLIDMYRLPEACVFLKKWTKALPENDPLQLPAGLLLGEALYAQGSSNTASLVEALAVYDKLLSQTKSQPTLLNRLQYLRGTTLEQLPDGKDPAKKREKEAFQAYHSVLETTTPPAEWEYFERCGFSALALLEKASRWQAAITVAEKIALFKGPRSQEAAARASKIKLERMIWED